MRMGKAAFLEFDDPGVGGYFPQHALDRKFMKQAFHLAVKHARYQVGPVGSCFARAEVCRDLLPSGVRRHSNEQVGTPLCRDESHRVEVQLVKCPRGTSEGRGQDNGGAHDRTRHRRRAGRRVGGSTGGGVPMCGVGVVEVIEQPAEIFDSEFVLVSDDPIESLILQFGVRVYDVLLEESACAVRELNDR